MGITSLKIICDILWKIYSAHGQIGLVFAMLLLSACIQNIETEPSPLYSKELNIVENTVPYSFTGEVARGQKFEKVLPNGLVFNLIPTEYANMGWMGWDIHIGPALESAQNYAGIATLPFRGTNTLHILGWHFRNADNTGPNDGSVNAPQEKRGFNFVLREADYEIASEAVECIMWPPLCEDMDMQTAIDLHQSVPTMGGILWVTELELGNLISGEQAWIEYMEFEVELNLPADWENDLQE